MTNPYERRTPPETEEEWGLIYSGVKKAHDMWRVVGPVVQVVQNWKWWAASGGITAWIYRTDLAAVVRLLIGGGQ